MAAVVFTEHLDAPAVDRAQILRYAGAKEESPALAALLDDVLAQALDQFTYSVCWAEYPLTFADGKIDLGFSRTDAKSLAGNLAGCHKVVVFGATVGIALDRLLTCWGKTAPAKALLLQALGAERIESLCDAFQQRLADRVHEQGCSIRPRFSPGYGDFPLEAQRDIFRVLSCPQRIGLTLNDSLLMSPSKSVTAIIGISRLSQESCSERCNACGKSDCAYRRTI